MTTILTIDDSPTIRGLLRAALTGAGFEVIQAADGEEGLVRLAEATPDVVITDLNMPRLDGFGFIERARELAACRSVPILVLTTEADGEKKRRAREAGATGWIVKPFDAPALIAAIRRVGGEASAG